jgi:hypothetical protein
MCWLIHQKSRVEQLVRSSSQSIERELVRMKHIRWLMVHSRSMIDMEMARVQFHMIQ